MRNRPIGIPRRKHPSVRRRGMILIVVLVVISVLTLAAMTFSELMLAEREAAELSARRTQARALVDSGVEATRLFLSQEEDLLIEAGGWYDNPGFFQGMLVTDDTDARKRGRFAVLTPYFEDAVTAGIRFGLEDDSTRLNVNLLATLDNTSQSVDQITGAAASSNIQNINSSGVGSGGGSSPDASAQQILMGLPGMTDQIADAILDWIDADDEPREFGAEVDYYSALDPPYAPKNGPLDTVEELLLVRDVTPWLLFGADTNRNGLIDPGEPDPQTIAGVDNSDGSMNRGWAAYLTLYSLESNLGPDGEPKIDLNQDDLKTLYQKLTAVFDEEWATFIVALRQSGPYTGTKPPSLTQPAGKIKISGSGATTLTTVLDLIGVNVEAEFEGQKDQKVVLESPFPNDPMAMSTYLPDLMENLAVNAQETIPGRININQASRTVLSGIPNITDSIVEGILASRISDPFNPDSTQTDETWILTEGIVTLEEMKQMMPYVCVGGSALRGQIVGYFDGGGPSVRIEVVFDTTKQPPSVLFWRDMSHLGRGYALETLGIEAGADY